MALKIEAPCTKGSLDILFLIFHSGLAKTKSYRPLIANGNPQFFLFFFANTQQCVAALSAEKSTLFVACIKFRISKNLTLCINSLKKHKKLKKHPVSKYFWL